MATLPEVSINLPIPNRRGVLHLASELRAPNLGAILEATSTELAPEADDVDQYYGQPTLKLDVKNIQIFRIKAVSYQKSRRSVMRHRWSEDKKSHF